MTRSTPACEISISSLGNDHPRPARFTWQPINREVVCRRRRCFRYTTSGTRKWLVDRMLLGLSLDATFVRQRDGPLLLEGAGARRGKNFKPAPGSPSIPLLPWHAQKGVRPGRARLGQGGELRLSTLADSVSTMQSKVRGIRDKLPIRMCRERASERRGHVFDLGGYRERGANFIDRGSHREHGGNFCDRGGCRYSGGNPSDRGGGYQLVLNGMVSKGSHQSWLKAFLWKSEHDKTAQCLPCH